MFLDSKPFFDTTNDFSPINDLVVGTGVNSDTVDLAAGASRGFMAMAAGNIKIRTAAGNDVTIAIPATATGIIQYIRVKRLWATGTTIAQASILLAY